jgi:hypothetical protein
MKNFTKVTRRPYPSREEMTEVIPKKLSMMDIVSREATALPRQDHTVASKTNYINVTKRPYPSRAQMTEAIP